MCSPKWPKMALNLEIHIPLPLKYWDYNIDICHHVEFKQEF